ncbi:MAG: aminoacyl-tRNA hydrolase [Spirochaetaceae bacterium]|jgi:PTH1 family peptidyl-tRNA hydrolase|nr:aminoacyl-tRNA hydrolase [Spirochaetaceae bacterium]
MTTLVAFLGNPGPEYARTRHNAGRILASSLDAALGLSWRRKYQGLYASLAGAALAEQVREVFAEEETPPPAALPPVHFLMPETFMNRSGASIAAASSFLHIPPEHILVVHDELELPLGMVSLKFSGGLGGHNGLRSAKAALGSPDFWRLRIGIGRPAHKDIAGWVLEAFGKDEEPALSRTVSGAKEALLRALLRGPETLLPAWSKKDFL